jgi:trehalose/maltose hydrolase-like predicted phosphorylase
MAGTVDLVQRCYTGLDLTGGVLRLDPRLPDEVDTLELRLRYRNHWGVTVRCDHDGARISLARSRQPPITVALDGGERALAPGETWAVRWSDLDEHDGTEGT